MMEIRMYPRTRRAVFILSAAVLAACSGDTPAGVTDKPVNEEMPPTGEPELRLIGSDVLLENGESELLSADSRITRWRFLWWSTSNSSIVTVQNGRITAVREGSASVSVLSLGGLQTWPVRVYDKSTAALELTPDAPAVDVGQSVALAAALRTGTGESIPLEDATFSSDNPSVAGVSGGRLVGVSRGTTTLRAAARGMTRAVPVSVGSLSAPAPEPTPPPATITSVRLSPRTGVTLPPGGQQQFSASVAWSDANGGQSRAVTVLYSATGGTVDASGLYQAPASAGNYLVIGAPEGSTLRDTARVTVEAPAPAPTPTLTGFSISPKTASLTTGEARLFSVSTTWSDGQARAVSVSYSAPNGGTVSASGVFTAPASAGTYRVIAAEAGGSRRDTATVTVSAPTLTELTISPKTASIQVGGTQQFAVSGRLSNGTSTTPSVTWSRIGSGSVSTSGLFTAPSTAGTYRVVATASNGALADTATVTVTAPAPTVSSFTLSPASVTLSTGQTRQFSTAVQWSDGASRSVSVSYQATGGTISVGGLYSAGQVAGSFLVIATCSCGAADTSAVIISAPQLASLTITPQTATLQAGAQQQFGATAQWSTGSTTLPPVSYSVIGGSANGTINATTGLYTAPGAAGTYRVVVAHSGGSLRDTATVTVQAPVTQQPPPTGGAAPTAFTPNLPSGLQLIVDSRFNSLAAAGQFNSEGLAYYWDGRHATDATAPYGSSVFETFYAGNNRGNGEGGANLYGQSGRNWRRMYFSLMMWVPANYSTHSNGEKFFYPIVNTNGQQTSSTMFGWAPIGSDTPNGSTFGFWYQAQIGDDNVWQPTSGARVRKGEWTQVEFYVVMNSPGQRNGIWQVWVNGQQVVNKTDARYSAQSVQSYFDGIRFSGVRGGGASSALTPPEGQVRRYNRLAFYASQN
jgi:uncharacterized protein YjdB